MAQVRDYEVIGPNAKSFADELSREKVVIVGKLHVPNVERALRGEEIEKPLPWPDYVRSHDRRARRDIAMLERITAMPIEAA